MASPMHYLTVQDILWINLQVTEKVHPYNFAKLEEATFYQYAYGESSHVVSQAARFAVGFSKMQPIEAGNDATNFIALLAFLKLNGLNVVLKDDAAASWFHGVQSKSIDVQEAIKMIAKPTHEHSHADVRSTIKDLLKEFSGTLSQLN